MSSRRCAPGRQRPVPPRAHQWMVISIACRVVSEGSSAPRGTRTMKCKIQVVIGGASAPMMIYDQKRRFQALLDERELDGPALVRRIRTDGVQGVKGYFLCFAEEADIKEGTLAVIDKILPPEPW